MAPMNIFYAPEIAGDMAYLDEVESGHAVKVMRLKKGDNLTLTDGKGNWYEGIVEVSHPKRCQVRIVSSKIDGENRNYRLTIAVAPTKNADRIEWFLEKATEIGINTFIPVLCAFSERKNINSGRLGKVALAAMKQSLKSMLPHVKEIISFSDLISRPFEGRKLIAHCYAGPKPHLKNVVKPGENVLILIGPEGDFSQEEVKKAVENGFQEVTLGSSRLRTETAALVACVVVAMVNEK